MQDVEVEDRRGTVDSEVAGSWEVLLLREPGEGAQGDVDAIGAQLVRSGTVTKIQPNVQTEMFAKRLKEPGERWALLAKLKGHRWCYLCVTWRDYDTATDLASKSGLSVLFVGHQDTASATFVQHFEGGQKVLEFESVGYVEEGDPGGKSDTTFDSKRHKRAWLKQFEDEFAAQSALVAELDAYAPFVGAAASGGLVELGSLDEDLERPDVWERIDLLVFAKG